MKLNGWYRIGVVLSVLWFFFTIGFTIYQYNYPSKYSYPRLVSLTSSWIPDNPYMKSDTTKKIITTKELIKLEDVVWDKPVIRYGNILLYMIVPVVSGWLLVLTMIWSIKWIIRGFKSHSSKS